MNIKELAAKPKLQKVTVDSKVIVEAYGEPLEFYMYDRMDIPAWMKLAALKDDQTHLMSALRDIIRDENGSLVLEEGELLPIEILKEVIDSIVAQLGNSHSQTLPA
jgi:hypothetical protein